MKKIKTFGLTNLRVEECFGYLKLVQTETANLVCPLPPQRWIMDHRLEKAKTLLLENIATAQDVGYMVGFKNRSHFSQAFKKRFGYAPSNYIKLYVGK